MEAGQLGSRSAWKKVSFEAGQLGIDQVRLKSGWFGRSISLKEGLMKIIWANLLHARRFGYCN